MDKIEKYKLPKELQKEIYKLSQLREMKIIDGNKELIFVYQVKKFLKKIEEEKC